jgi:hypothetical protein
MLALVGPLLPEKQAITSSSLQDTFINPVYCTVSSCLFEREDKIAGVIDRWKEEVV